MYAFMYFILIIKKTQCLSCKFLNAVTYFKHILICLWTHHNRNSAIYIDFIKHSNTIKKKFHEIRYIKLLSIFIFNIKTNCKNHCINIYSRFEFLLYRKINKKCEIKAFITAFVSFTFLFLLVLWWRRFYAFLF